VTLTPDWGRDLSISTKQLVPNEVQMQRFTKPSEAVVNAVRKMADAGSIRSAARALNVSETTAARLAAGAVVTIATLRQAETSLGL
jgi:hypothetical protein